MGNFEDKEQNCFFCNTEVDGKYTIEFDLREDIVCFACEMKDNTGIKVYNKMEGCQLCGSRTAMTRRRIVKLKKSVCSGCYDNFYNTQEVRDMSKIIVGKNNMNKKFIRYGYVCIYCDILYNKITSRELRTINYTFIPVAKKAPRYENKETLVPTCYFCNHAGKYMRKCQVYSDKL